MYQITPTQILPPPKLDLERKEEWLKEIQRTIPSEWEFVLVKVKYELFDPAIQDQQRFFEGACVAYYAIQNLDMTVGRPDAVTLKMYRETILDEMLGYDLQLVNRTARRRTSTTDWKSVSKWNTFLKTLEETLFDSHGYEFPDSEHFWKMVKEHGHDQAKEIVIDQLQNRIKLKLQCPKT
jgi:hypothetical protein